MFCPIVLCCLVIKVTGQQDTTGQYKFIRIIILLIY